MRGAALNMMLAFASLSACHSNPHAHESGRTVMQIEVLGFSDCPNTPEFLRRVRLASAQLSGSRLLYVDQESLPESDVRRGYPTPTALVNGRDLFGLPVPTTPSMGCRLYEGGLPDVDTIAARLRSAAGR